MIDRVPFESVCTDRVVSTGIGPPLAVPEPLRLIRIEGPPEDFALRSPTECADEARRLYGLGAASTLELGAFLAGIRRRVKTIHSTSGDPFTLL